MLGDDLFNRCVQLVSSWKPKQKYAKEDDYRDDLREFLFIELNKPNSYSFGTPEKINVKIESGRTLCDIAIGRSIGIELKMGKEGKIKKAEIDRLHGQLAGHKKDYSQGMIVVLVGDVDDYSEADVRDKMKELHAFFNNSGFTQYGLKLINKSFNKVVQKQQPYGWF